MNISVNNISFSYSGIAALENVSFSANSGECVAILGVNGAGKSTLLKCIDRILPYSSGCISVGGRAVEKMKASELAKTVGYVPQRLCFAEASVFDAVLTGRIPYIRREATKNDLEITEKIIEKLGLSHLALRNVRELSGGEQQKLAIARALVQQTKALLFDEPTSNLDIKNQIMVTELIREIAAGENITVIVTMHDINLSLRFADRFIMMKDNCIYAAGGREIISPETIFEVYGIKAALENVCGQTLVIPL